MTCRRATLLLALGISLSVPRLARAAAAAKPPASAEARGGKEAEKETDEGAASKSGRLQDKIPPVSGNLFKKGGRFEISPTSGLSLADAFFQKYTFGLKLSYHVSESLSFGAFGSYAIDTVGGAVSVCRDDVCSSPKMEELTSVPGKLGLIAGAEVAWAPLYGKVNLFAEKVLHFDTGIVAGASLVQYAAPNDVMTTTIGGHVGIGQRYFLTSFMTLRLELRDYIYSAQIAQLGNQTQKIENQLMLEIGLSLFAGQSPKD